MRILVTGANGFVGRHLVRELKEQGHEPIALVYGMNDKERGIPGATAVFEGEIADTKWLTGIVASQKPDACIHLAGISFVPDGAANPGLVFSVNVMDTLSVLEAFRQAAPAARILTISSSHVYGNKAGRAPLKESHAFAPANHYAASKAAADMLTLVYAKEHGMKTMTVRPYNHIGPGQSARFVVPAFAAQLKKIAGTGGKGRLSVGNLESMRDFMDVRDVVRAYRLLIEKGHSGEAYNLASGKLVKVGDILEMLMEIAEVRPDVQVDPKLYRKAAKCPLLNTAKIEKDTGWRPEITLAQSLRDIYAAV